MSPFEKNPFHEAYVTDTVPNDQFVAYFSPFLIPHAPEIFLPGNVIVKGSQGCGKSMLLRLLEPEIRLAYHKRMQEMGRDQTEFPVPTDHRLFVGARVNLSKSGLLDITQTISSKASPEAMRALTISFGDYFNYWMLKDLLQSVALAGQHTAAFDGLVTVARLDAFAASFCSQDCLFGYMEGVNTFEGLRKAVADRVIHYRKWTNGNAELPSSVLGSRSAIGEPLSRAAVCLKEAGVIANEANVFLTIDQLEAFWTNDPDSIGSMLRREIHELIGRRDGRVSYRLGARRYNWNAGDLKMRVGRDLEDGRDFLTTDVDFLLRRKEVGTWPFRKFAADVFQRRLMGAFGDLVAKEWKALYEPTTFFGTSLEGAEWLQSLVTNPPESPERLLALDDNWPQPWREAIAACYGKALVGFDSLSTDDYPKDPLAAVLLAAWGLQKGGRASSPERRTTEQPPITSDQPPWTKLWWKKERMPQAFLQITARHQQRLYWAGWEHVLGLSGSNILFFVRICREVWDMWRRLNQGDPFDPRAKKGVVPQGAQFLALHNISLKMHELFSSQPGRPAGNVRMRFLDELSSWMRSKLIEDKAMSNPGHNGFSLTRSELESAPDLRMLLEEAVGWGDLYEVPHTSKKKGETASDPRRKYYLNPILSPYYQLPHAHTKEPIYNALEKLKIFAARAHHLTQKSDQASPLPTAAPTQSELPLFTDQ